MIAKLFLLYLLVVAIQGRPSETENLSLDHVYVPDFEPFYGDVATADDQCPPDMSHYLLPHEYDCTLFYYCEYGKKWETPRQCAPGTQFSYELQVCVHETIANCQLPGSPPPATDAPEKTTTEEPTTPEPTTPKPTTPEPTTPEPTTPKPTTPEPTTPEPTTPEPTTPEPTTPEPTTPEPTTPKPTTPEPTTTESTTPEPTTPKPTTPEPTTPKPTTPEPTTPEPTTPEPTTPEPTTPKPTTPEPTTPEPTTPEPTTPEPTTPEPTTPEPTTPKPTTPEPTTPEPTTPEPTTPEPTTPKPTTPEPTTTEATTTEADGDDEWLENGCPADFDKHWLLPSNNCSRFYYCVFGEKVERECPAGLAFNPEIQVCDWPENVNCENSGDGDNGSGDNGSGDNGSGDGGDGSGDGDVDSEWLENGCPADFDKHWLLPSQECNKFYYCVFGEKVEKVCPSGLYFNPELQVCDWPENVECGGSSEVTTESVTTEAPTKETTQPIETTTPESTEQSTPETVTKPDGGDNGNSSGDGEWLENGCPADYDIHWLLPAEECSNYYQCVFGETVKRPCPTGLLFNPELQVCDWPENVECGGSSEVTTESVTTVAPTEETTQPIETTTPESTEQSTPETVTKPDGGDGSGDEEWLENGCPADYDIHWLLPAEECSNYYQCVFGETVKRPCPPGLLFNPELQVCDWPENVECGGDGSGGSSEVTTESVTTVAPTEETTQPIETTTPESTEQSTPETVTKPDGGDGSGDGEWLENGCPADYDIHWLLPAEECSNYYQCVFGEPVKRPCPPGLLFNPELQVCDWPENVECNGNGGDGSGDGGDGDNETTTDEPETTTDGSGDGGNGDGDNGSTTDEPDHSQCAEQCNILPWSHETACDKYWRCEGDRAVLVTCSEGLHFNANTGNCDFICNANCERTNTETTALAQGLKIFVPWDKVDETLRRTYGFIN